METIQDSAERTITLGLGLNPEIKKVDFNLTLQTFLLDTQHEYHANL